MNEMQVQDKPVINVIMPGAANLKIIMLHLLLFNNY